MANLHFKLEGEPGSITVDAFIAAVTDWFKVLNDVDSAISGQPKGSLEWVVTDLSTGSLTLDAESHSRLPDRNYAPDVLGAAISGMRRIEYEGLTPPYLSPRGIRTARRLLKVIGTGGVSSISIANHAESVELTARAVTNVDDLLPIRYTVIGSVEGKLEAISIHEREPRCIVYHDRTHQAVTCVFPIDMLADVKEGLGKRVIALGAVDMNGRHEPVRVHLERLRPLRSEQDLPSIADIGGSDPRFTGGLESSAYIRSMRDG